MRLLLHHAVEQRAWHLQQRTRARRLQRRRRLQRLLDRRHLRHRQPLLLQQRARGRRGLLEPVGDGGDVGERGLADVLQQLHARGRVAEVHGVEEATHGVLAAVGDLQHLLELRAVAGDQVEEGELLEALGLLVADLHDGVVALAQRLGRQLVPDGRLVQLRRALVGDVQVAAADGEVEAGARLRDEVERDVLEAIALQVADDGLRVHLAGADDADGFAVVLLLQRHLL